MNDINLEDHIAWAENFSRRFRWMGIDDDELMSLARYALVIATRAKPKKERPFRAIAAQRICRAIHLAVVDKCPVTMDANTYYAAVGMIKHMPPTKTARRLSRKLVAQAARVVGGERVDYWDAEPLAPEWDDEKESLAADIMRAADPVTREILTLHLGLDGSEPLNFAEIDERMGFTGPIRSYNRYRAATAKLRAIFRDTRMSA